MHYAKKKYRKVDVQIHMFLTSALVGEWSASCTGHFTPRKTAPSTHWIGEWVAPRTSLNNVERRKNFAPTWT
jgi:hypothetical protein